jgi:hypothetical protein
VSLDESHGKNLSRIDKSEELKNAVYILMEEGMRKVLGMFAIDMKV